MITERNRFWWMLGGSLALVGIAIFALLREPRERVAPQTPPAPDGRSSPLAVGRTTGEDPGAAVRALSAAEAEPAAGLVPANAVAVAASPEASADPRADTRSFVDAEALRTSGAGRPLSRTPNPSSEDCLDALASSPIEADRVRAAMLLGRRAAEAGLAEVAVPALIAALKTDETPQVWLVAAQALGKYGDEAIVAVPSLLAWFDHLTMRDVAIDALASIGPGAATALPSISAVAANGQERFLSRRKAIEALVRIEGPDGPYVQEALRIAATEPEPRLTLAANEAVRVWLTTPETNTSDPNPPGGG